MTQPNDTHNRYAEQYAAQPDAGTGWLRELRQAGFDSFSRLGFPTARRGNEAWKYTNVAPIARAELSAPAANGAMADPDAARGSTVWSDDWNTLVFVNGRYSAELSSVHDADGLSVTNLPRTR